MENKQKKHVSRLALKISKGNLWLVEELQAEAVRQNRTVNNLVETILLEYFLKKNEKNSSNPL
jgi:hypothetical protein